MDSCVARGTVRHPKCVDDAGNVDSHIPLALAGIYDIARAILRVPLVHLRLVIETPAVWAPLLGAGLVVLLAWYVERIDRADRRWPRIVEMLACLFGLFTFVWMFHAGQYPWRRGDWPEEWTFFLAWKQALAGGGVPYYLGTAMQGTERYLANLQTPLMPYVLGLGFLSINTFLLVHLALVYAAGFIGAITLRRELAIGLLPWTLFVLIFTLNGHIVAHLCAGHLPWIAYFLTPWVLWSLVRIVRGDRSFGTVVACALTFAGMILIGGWHVFVWAWLFMLATCALSPSRLIVAATISVVTALLAAARIAPAFMTFGTGSNIFLSGYPSWHSLFEALVASPEPTPLLDAWEIDAYIGYVGLLLMGIGAIPFRDSAKRFMNVLLLPTASLIVLSLGRLYGETLFRLPGLVSERVTTRLIVIPILWLTLASAVRIDAWWQRNRRSIAATTIVLLTVAFLAIQLMLRAQAWRPGAGPNVNELPVEVLKAMPAEPIYFWAFWSGVVISTATAAIVIANMKRASRPFRFGLTR